jgi:hypothetical protein
MMVSFATLACVLLATFPTLALAHPKDHGATAKLLDLHRRTAAVGSQAIGKCNNTMKARDLDKASVGVRVATLNMLRQNLGFRSGKFSMTESISYHF